MKEVSTQGQVVELDVRPYLKKKLDPFQYIMDAVKKLNKEDRLVLHATFKPTPLLGVMRMKGFLNKAEKLDKDHWVVTFVHKSRSGDWSEPDAAEEEDALPEAVPVKPGGGKVWELDNRGLEPPQPMVRTLKKLADATPGDTVIIHNDRVPLFLIEELNGLGYAYDVDEQPDGSAIVKIEKRQAD